MGVSKVYLDSVNHNKLPFTGAANLVAKSDLCCGEAFWGNTSSVVEYLPSWEGDSKKDNTDNDIRSCGSS